MNNENTDTLTEGVVNQSSESLKSNEVQVKSDELLKVLVKEVPNYDWKFQRIETKEIYHEIENFGSESGINSIKWVYQCRKNDVLGTIHISYNCRSELEFECEFSDRVSWCNSQKIHIKPLTGFDENKLNGYDENKMWNDVREFFETYLIPEDERIENEIHTPRIEETISKLNHTYLYEFNTILLETLFNSCGRELRIVKGIFKKFNDQLKSMYMERGLDFTDKKYFSSEIQMIQSFLESSVDGYLEMFIEDLINDIEEDEEFWEFYG